MREPCPRRLKITMEDLVEHGEGMFRLLGSASRYAVAGAQGGMPAEKADERGAKYIENAVAKQDEYDRQKTDASKEKEGAEETSK